MEYSVRAAPDTLSVGIPLHPIAVTRSSGLSRFPFVADMGKENDIGRPELYGPGKNSTELSPEKFRQATEGGKSWCVRVISARGVPKKDLLSESDPYVALSIVDEKGEPVHPLQVCKQPPLPDAEPLF